LNNGGIGPGMSEIPENPMFNMKPNALIYGARYDSVRTSRLRKREGVGLSRVGCGVGISRGASETVARSTDILRRQRVLERVGWRFWRCWASSFAIDPDACMADLFATLERFHVHPVGDADGCTQYAEHRTVSPVDAAVDSAELTDIDFTGETEALAGKALNGIRPGDRVVIRYLDDNKTATFTLSNERNDPTNGLLSVTSPLGKQLLGLVEEDETEFEIEGHMRRVLIVRAERQPVILH
jgi:hypothetical protein